MQLTAVQSSASTTGSAGNTRDTVQPAPGKSTDHRFSSSLNGQTNGHDAHPSEAPTEGKNRPGQADKKAAAGAESSHAQPGTEPEPASTSDRELAQQIAYLLHTQQAVNPLPLQAGFGLPAGATGDPAQLSAMLANLPQAGLKGGIANVDRLSAADLSYESSLAEQPLTPLADNLDVNSQNMAHGSLAADPELSALVTALADKTVTAPVVAMSQHGLNALASAKDTTIGQPTTAPADMATPNPTLSVDISKPQWGDALIEQLRQRIHLQAGNKLQHAQIRLDPPELGKLDISLRMEGDKLSVQFTAAHPQLREALLASSDRLRHDFSQSQMNLIDVSVSGGQPQHGNHPQQDTGFASGHTVIRRSADHSSVPALNLSRHRADFDSLV